jgi:hypothetical protein
MAAGGEASTLLAEFVGGVRGVLDAERVSLLLLDSAGRLAPTIAVARHDDHVLWQEFRGMRPIPVDEMPRIRDVLTGAPSVVVEDSRSSPLVPQRWREMFGFSPLVVATVSADRSPLGVLVLERPSAGSGVSTTSTTLLKGVAALAGVALGGWRDLSRPESVTSLSAYVDAAAMTTSTVAVAEHLLTGAVATARVTRGLVVASERPLFPILAGADQWDDIHGLGTDVPPAELVAACEHAWARGRTGVVYARAFGRAVALLPVRGRRRVYAVLALEAQSLPDGVCDRLRVLARISGSAMERLHAQEVIRRDDDVRRFVARSLDVARSVEARGEIDLLLRDVAASIGCRTAEVFAASDTVARATGWRRADRALRSTFVRWRRQQPGSAMSTADDGVVYVPIPGGDSTAAGVLTLWPQKASLGHRDVRRASLVATSLGYLARSALEQRRYADASRVLATADARAAVAARCYAESTEVLGRLDASLPTAPGAQGAVASAQARSLINEARRLVRDAADASRQRRSGPGLRRALTELCAGVAARTGLAVALTASGRAPALDDAARVALLHAVRSTLHAFDRARAATVTVHATLSPFDVVVCMRADAAPTLALEFAEAGLHATIRHARAWLQPIGGRVDFTMVAGEPRFTLAVPMTGAARSRPTLTPARGERPRSATASGGAQ